MKERRRLALISLLTWSAVTTSVDGSLLKQHRVKCSQRKVAYQNQNDEKQQRVGGKRIISTRNYVDTTTTTPKSTIQKEILYHDDNDNDDHHTILWMYDVTDHKKYHHHTNTQQKKQQQQHQQQNTRRRLSSLRRLFDQFVGGEEFPPQPTTDGNHNNSSSTTTTTTTTTNITTEVEFETTIIDDNGVESTTTTTTTTTTESTTNNDHVGGSSGSSSTTTTNTGHNNNNATTAGNITESVVYTKPTEDGNTTTGTNDTSSNTINSTNTPLFQPLRIRAILAEDSGNKGSLLNETQRNILFHDMLSPALLAWSTSLRVDPVQGNLTVDVTQLLDGETCGPGKQSGLPSIKVPIQHIQQGIPETDMIVYLSLGFAISSSGDNNNTTNTNSTTLMNDTSLIDHDEDEDKMMDETTHGMEDDDLIIYAKEPDSMVGFGSWIKDKIGGGRRRRRRRKLLSSSEYNNDTEEEESLTPQGGRSGFLINGISDDYADGVEEGNTFNAKTNANKNTSEPINICTGDYLAAASYCSSDQYDRPTAALLHICIDDTFFEPKHLQRNILAIMHELGHALGFNSLSMAHLRRPDGTPYTPRDKNGDVPDRAIECTGPGKEHQSAMVALPAEDILRFREVRGGVRVAEIVTPSVLQVVRNQFDCQLLTGAELESGEGSPLSVSGDEGCIGDHWERRLFSSDLMNPVVDDLEYSTRISTLTLAYFADSGWYQVDLSNADVASGWGRGAGCSFVNDTCINENGEVPPQNAPFFCNEVPSTGFSMSANIHGCTPDLSRKATCSIGQYDLDLPPAYQYFNSTYGADVGGSDSLMDFCPVYMGYDNGLCSSSDGESAIRAFDVERFGQRNSRCLVGNVRPFLRNTALCLPIACVIQDHSLRVCPTFFCPYDCLGTPGACDYKTGQCLCEYENKTSTTGETYLDACGIVEEVEVTEGSTLRPILRPRELKNDPAVPPPDTKLSDYYVADVRHLDDNPLLKPWAIALVGLTGVVLVSLIVATVSLRKSSGDHHRHHFSFRSFFWFWKSRDDDDNDMNGQSPPSPPDGINREKDKMVATVLVDMRIQNNRRWRRNRRQQQEQHEGDEETEGRLTESEVASSSGPESISDVSSRRSETMSECLDMSQGDIDPADLPTTTVEEPQVIRRRRFNPDVHEC